MKNKKGFTLIELIVVIAIIAILALILVPQVTGYIDNANEVVCITNTNQLTNEISRGYISGDVDENDLLNNHNKNVKTITDMLGLDITELEHGDGLILSYENGVIDVICLEHQNGSDASGESGDDTEDPDQTDNDGIISLTDNEGIVYDLTSKLSFDSLKAENTSGFSLSSGDTITDGEKTYAVSWNNYINIPNNSDYSIDDLASKNGLIEINESTNIYTNNDISNNGTGNKWSESIAKGSVAYYNGVYYIAPQNINVNTFPPGGWVKLNIE
jgi:type IV pilus assembly protein PilA